MALNKYKPEKIYYTISEVADMLGVTTSALRVWERSFDELHPRRTSTGNRIYTKDDIDTVAKICDLLKQQGMTIDGAKRLLKSNPDRVDRTYELTMRLKSIRDELQSVIDQL